MQGRLFESLVMNPDLKSPLQTTPAASLLLWKKMAESLMRPEGLG
jgi:hypothetical protein